MVFFSLISELPYQQFLDSDTLNVFPSLTLGLLVALGLYHRTAASLAMAALAVVSAFCFEQVLMYGFFGVLLPAAFVLMMKRPNWPMAAFVPAVICILMNSRYGGLERVLSFELYNSLKLLAALSSVFLGVWLLRQRFTVAVWKVGYWGYWFYPAHLIALAAMSGM